MRQRSLSKVVMYLLLWAGVINAQNPQLGTTLFAPGDGGYNCFRIPAVVKALDGTILAFAEARKTSCSDTGNIDLVLRRSTDEGISWSPLEVIWDDGDNVCGNPAPVVDRQTGMVHLLTTWNLGEDHESEIIDGTSKETREVYHMTSSDHGKSWTSPKNITSSVKQPNWTWYATGPVHGIQMVSEENNGRLVIPCDHIEKDTKQYYSHVIYSDNGGETWQLGGRTPKDQVNECSVAELSNGELLLNMRNYERKKNQVRQEAISRDGGLSWEKQKFVKSLPEPRCQGALLGLNRKEKGKNVILFSNPLDPKNRLNMTISISQDDGKSWKRNINVYKGPSAYSDMVELKDNMVMILFEAGTKNPYEGIHFKRIKIL